MRFVAFIILYLLCSTQGVCQETVDTSVVESIDSIQDKKDIGLLYMFKGDPGRAALLSLLVPSGGQFYNKKIVKGILVIGAEAAAISTALYFNREYNSAQEYYLYLLNGGTPLPDRPFTVNSAREVRNDTRQIREYMWFGYGVLHLVTVIDAFVDRHLMTFDVSEDLTMQFKNQPLISPVLSGLQTHTFGLSFTMTLD